MLLIVSFLQKLAICRTTQLSMHYFIGANSFWILVEGIYLFRLLVAAVLSEKHLPLKYVLIGWGKYGYMS